MIVKEKTPEKYLILVKLCALGLVWLSFCSGCGNHHGELFSRPGTPLVWPGPPEKPRIRYVGAISTEADLKTEVSWSQGLGQLLFGKKKTGVLLAPYAVAIDQYGRLFVTDTAGAAVHLFDLKTREYKQFADLAGGEKLLKPVGLTIVDNRIYVTDSALRKVCVFDRDGQFIFSFAAERLKRPSGIAYWQAGEIVYVADTARHTIDVFTKDGKFIQQIGARGLYPGMFNFPTHLWVDKDGKLYVSDTLNYRIQIFTSGGKLLKIFGQQGDRPGNFAHPCGIATDGFGNIYVTDRQFENVQVFNQQGYILMTFGQEGTQAGQFWLPAGIFIDNYNRIYVADLFNKRIQIFELLEDIGI
ncbi:MAG: 6-bladed beta-propeller [Planctomycetota bacterium]|jgi:DNA-binding beta-propeller fold protein YncE